MANQNNPVDRDEQEIDLRVYIQILKKRRAFIGGITLLAVLASAIVSFFILQPVYEARTVLLVSQPAEKLQTTSQGNSPDSIINNLSRIPVPTMNTYIGQLKSDALMLRVIEHMGLAEYGYTPRGLNGQVKVTNDKDSYLLDIAVNNKDPQLARDIANTLSQEFIASITERNQEVMNRSVVFLEEQMEAVRRELAGAESQAERERLQGTLNLLSEGITRTQIARSFDLGSTSLAVVSPAMSAVRVKPDAKMNIAIAFLLGLMASVALALLLEFLDNTIKTTDDIARHLELPVMGMIPDANGRAGNYYYGSD
ncbi:MAG: Capsular polysaccharide type 8 biosynthesis protein cap8A [Firmicutes bacterium ADurb.Bin373]|nr:MAG: Capsular polysaccharide type 8 biosynthesis protein cap8A [Firmicutes bacterium ADurb.Bin373]